MGVKVMGRTSRGGEKRWGAHGAGGEGGGRMVQGDRGGGLVLHLNQIAS